jgi:hypothetical protein
MSELFYIISQSPDSIATTVPNPDTITSKVNNKNSSELTTKEDSIFSTKKTEKSILDTSNSNKSKENTKNIVTDSKTEIKEVVKIESPVKFGVEYNTDLIPYLYKDTPSDLLIKKNFLLQLKSNNNIQDSILTKKDDFEKELNARKVFPLKKKEIEYQDIKGVVFSQDWVLIILLSSLVAIGWTRVFYNKFILLVFKAAFNYQLSYKLFRENNSVYQRTSFLFNIHFVLSISLFIYLCLHYYLVFPENKNHALYFLIISVIVLSFYLLKYVVYKILAYIIKEENVTNEYLHNTFIYNKILGITLLPLIISIPYIMPLLQEPLIILGLITIAIFFIMSLVRGFVVTMKTNISIFYLILYLCVLEILPILVLLKLLKTLV